MTHPAFTIAGQVMALTQSRFNLTPAERVEANKAAVSGIFMGVMPQAGSLKGYLSTLVAIEKLGGVATYSQILASDASSHISPRSIREYCQRLEQVGLIKSMQEGLFKEAKRKITPAGVAAIPVLQQRLNDIEIIA